MGDEDGQPVGFVVRTGKMVGGGFRGGIGRIGCERGVFGEKTLRVQRTIDLVGGDLQEAKPVASVGGQSGAVLPAGIQQPEGSHHVCLDEIGRPFDGAVDVRLGGEIHHGRGLVLFEQFCHPRPVADIALHETVPGVLGHLGQRLQAAGIGQLVERNDRGVCFADRHPHKTASDEARAAGYEYGWIFLCHFNRSGVFWKISADAVPRAVSSA